MQGPLAWPLRLLGWRSRAGHTWTLGAGGPGPRPPLTGLWPARPWGAGPGLLRDAGAARGPRRWTSGCPGGGPRGPGGGAGVARLLGQWARPPGASRCGALAGPDAPRLRRAGLRGGPAVAARGGGEARPSGSALPAAAAPPGDDSRLRPVAARRSEAQKLLGLAYPERGRLAGRAFSVRSPRPSAHLTERVSRDSGGGRETPGHLPHSGEGRAGPSVGIFTKKSWTERSPLGSVVEPFRLAENLFSVVLYVCFLCLTHTEGQQDLITGVLGAGLLGHCQSSQSELPPPLLLKIYSSQKYTCFVLCSYTTSYKHYVLG